MTMHHTHLPHLLGLSVDKARVLDVNLNRLILRNRQRLLQLCSRLCCPGTQQQPIPWRSRSSHVVAIARRRQACHLLSSSSGRGELAGTQAVLHEEWVMNVRAPQQVLQRDIAGDVLPTLRCGVDCQGVGWLHPNGCESPRLGLHTGLWGAAWMVIGRHN